MLVSQPSLAMGLGDRVLRPPFTDNSSFHGENFEKMTQYGEFGCIF